MKQFIIEIYWQNNKHKWILEFNETFDSKDTWKARFNQLVIFNLTSSNPIRIVARISTEVREVEVASFEILIP